MLNRTSPPPITFLVLAVSILPLMLHLAGFDFSCAGSPFDFRYQETFTQADLVNAMYASFSGSFTHTILEWSSVSVACVTVVLAFAHFKIRRDPVMPIIGAALFTAGMMDVFHTLAASRLISAAAPNADFIPFTWRSPGCLMPALPCWG